MTPTRELALQIEREAILLTKNTDIKTVCTYGGIPTKTHINEVGKGCDILIGTLGRIVHLTKIERVSIVNYFIRDNLLINFSLLTGNKLKFFGKLLFCKFKILFYLSFPSKKLK